MPNKRREVKTMALTTRAAHTLPIDTNSRPVDRTVVLSRALHRAVEPFILQSWERAREVMVKNIAMQRARARSAYVTSWIDTWESALNAGPEAVVALSRTSGERGDDLRQMTPLAGILPFEIQQRIARELPRVP
jgi:hypothetical protein